MSTPKLSRILCVEDEPDIQSIIRLALESVGGFTVEVCDSGSAALTVAPRFAPDLIVLDVMMPEMDGPATLAALRADAQTASIPVVFVTAKAQPDEVADYLAMGVLDVLPKPFDPMTLAEQLRGIWDRHHS